jgi:hypothetical protein
MASERASKQRDDTGAAAQKSASTSEDEEGDARQPEYLIPVLQESPPGANPAGSPAISMTRRHQAEATDDDESNQYFMSEPSLSEDGDSLSKIRAPHHADLLGTMRQSSRGGEDHRRQRGRFFSSSDDDAPSDNDNFQDSNDRGSSDNNTPQQRLEKRRAYRSPDDGRHQRQRRQAHAAAMSPGNTSLSSWENSPAVKPKVFLQFVMPESKYAKQARAQQQQQQQQQQASGSHVRLDSNNPNGPAFRVFDGYHKGRSNDSSGEAATIPSLGSSDCGGDRRYHNGGTTIPNGATLLHMHREPLNFASRPQRREHRPSQYLSQSPSLPFNGSLRVDDNFLQNIRRRSEGTVQNPSKLLAPVSFDKSHMWDQHGTDRAEVGVVMRHREHPLPGGRNGNDNSRFHSGEREHESSHGEIFSLSPIVQGGTLHSVDDSVAMTLSDSEAGDAVDESLHSERPLDWEAHHSADDEKTIQRPLRIRAKVAPGHRRTRSGDDAAAKLVTGRRGWSKTEFLFRLLTGTTMKSPA